MKNIIKKILIALAAGISIGLVAAFGDTLMNDGQLDPLLLLTTFFNTATVWGAATFLLGSDIKSKILAAFCGVLLLTSAVVSYYLYGVTEGNRTEISLDTIIETAGMWLVAGVVVGVIYGVAGSVYKFTKNSKAKTTSVVLLSTLLIAESAYYIYQSRDYLILDLSRIILIITILIGLISPTFLLQNVKRGIVISILSSILSAGGVLGFEYIFTLGR